MRFGSLFTGIGGFDLGFTQAGMTCAWQVEIDGKANGLLARHWPDVERHGDVRQIIGGLRTVDLVCGGDPCPKHSRARSNGPSNSPDLSGYFLAVVGGLRPRWVVRENVPAPTTAHFDAALAALGYGTVAVRLDAAQVTGQSRQRDFIIGRYQATRAGVAALFSDCAHGSRPYAPRTATRQVTPCLTTHRTRYDSRDCYIYGPDGFRILDGDERERLAGFPAGWTAGLSETARARMYGNAVVPQVAEWIGRRIVEVDRLEEAVPT